MLLYIKQGKAIHGRRYRNESTHPTPGKRRPIGQTVVLHRTASKVPAQSDVTSTSRPPPSFREAHAQRPHLRPHSPPKTRKRHFPTATQDMHKRLPWSQQSSKCSNPNTHTHPSLVVGAELPPASPILPNTYLRCLRVLDTADEKR